MRIRIRGLRLVLGVIGLLPVPGVLRAADEPQVRAAARDRATMMERFVVSDTRIDRNPWRYGAVDGFEILTRAGDDKTEWELDALRHGWALENEVIPKEWLPAAPIPYTVIVDDSDLGRLPSGTSHSQPVAFHPPSDALSWGRLADTIDVSFDPLEAFDSDTFAINTNLHGVDTTRSTYGTISLERISRCAPPLPRWLIAGLIGQGSGLFRESFVFDADGEPEGRASPGGPSSSITRAEGPGTLWVSVEETERLLALMKKDKKARLEILPMGVLFADPPAQGDRLSQWESEAGLFVRWGLMGPGRASPALSLAFKELVHRARMEPVTERVFSECFGFGYQAMQGRLELYLKQVLARPTSVDVHLPLHFYLPGLASATADDVGRILGDWMRMEAAALRTTDAELGQQYLESAGKVLWRAYRADNNLPSDEEAAASSKGSGAASPSGPMGASSATRPFTASASHLHDPSLLAVYGLYEHDSGNDGKAREFLEAAAKFGAARPQAYLVLAKLRYSDAIGEPRGADGRISSAQADTVLQLLALAVRSSPDPEACRMVVETWIHSEATPTQAEITSIVSGASLFPRDTGLAYRAAYLCANKGFPSKASDLIDRSLSYATGPAIRRYLEELRAQLPVSPESKAN